jgi:P pilus assembly chaperone PapD
MFFRNQAAFGRAFFAVSCIISAPLITAAPAMASVGDLLVAPTRVVFENARGTEVILNNIGSEEATYRISLELRRMNPQGGLDEIPVEEADAREKLALDLIRYAPKRVTLSPDQPQSIRVGLNPNFKDLPDGEYRVHLLFRAIPKTASVAATPAQTENVSIEITPIYGVTIPLIIRKGSLAGQAAIANPHLENADGRPTLTFDMTRKGNKSIYGNVLVTKPGVSVPLMSAKGIAIYPETDARQVILPLTEEAAMQMKGPVTISYFQSSEAGGALIAEVKAVLP